MFPIENQSAKWKVNDYPLAFIWENKQIAHKKDTTIAVVPSTPEIVFPNDLPKNVLIKKPTNGANNKSNIVVFI